MQRASKILMEAKKLNAKQAKSRGIPDVTVEPVGMCTQRMHSVHVSICI